MPKRCYGCMKLKEGSPVCEHCGYNENQPNYPHQLPVGTVLQERYRIGKALGQGGFGITYIGWDVVLDTPVAVKEYYPNSFVHRDSRNSTMVSCAGAEAEEMYRQNRDRFLREAKILAKLNNVPGIVRVQNLFGENNTAYIAMEYIEGIDLKHYLRNQGRALTVPEMLQILRPILEALEKVHDAELVHRDISPDNIMILPDGSAKLLDFGAAREVADAAVDKELPQSTEAILKHGFAPMEQYRRRGNLGPWTDVYGLCATIYYCLTGKVPNSAPERITGDDNIDWYRVPGLTKRQAATLEQGMALLPEKRIRSMGELRKRLLQEKKTEAAKPGKKLELPNFLKKKDQTRLEKKAEAPKAEKKAEPPKVEKKAEAPKVEKKAEPPKVEKKAGAPKVEKKAEPPKVEKKAEPPKVEKKSEQPKPKSEKKMVQDYAPTVPVAQEKPRKRKSILPMIGAAAVLVAVAAGMFLLKEKPESEVLAQPEAVVQDVFETSPIIYTENAQGPSTQELQYNEAARLEAEGQYAKAAIAFGKLGDYKDGRGRSFELWNKVANRETISAGDRAVVGIKSYLTPMAVSETMDEWDQWNMRDWSMLVAVSVGQTHAVGLKSDGTVVATGSNTYGQCEVTEWTDIVAISAGYYHTVGLKSDGTVLVVGDNEYGQCDVSGWTDIVAVSAGDSHTVGLKSDGTVVAVGYKRNTQCNVADWTDIVAVSAGLHYTIGLKSDGTVVAVGSNQFGKCDVTGWTDIIAVSAGVNHAVGLKSDGTVVAVGLKDYSQCDVAGWTDIVAVSAGMVNTVGLRSDGTAVAVGNNANVCYAVSCWTDIKLPNQDIPHNGSDKDNTGGDSGDQKAQYATAEELLAAGETAKAAIAFGKLGDYNDARERSFELWNNVAKRETISAGCGFTVGLKSNGTAVVVGDREYVRSGVKDWVDIIAVSAGVNDTVGLKSDGTVVAAGFNESGQCDVTDWTDIIAVSAGYTHTVGLKSDGTVVAAGLNDFGQCDVAGWTDIVAVSTGPWHTVGLKSDGTVVAVGRNDLGECNVAHWTHIVDVSAEMSRTVGLKSDGTVVTAGFDAYGCCDVTDWADIIAVSAEWAHTIGLKSDGTVVSVGFNEDGQCDVTDWTDIVAVSSGENYTVGLKSDGTVVAAGNNEAGQREVSGWTDIKLPN